MDSGIKKHIAKFFFLYFNQYAFNVLIWAFLTLFLLNEGASAETIGIVFAVSTVCALCGGLILGRVGDRVRGSALVLFVHTGLFISSIFMYAFKALPFILLAFYAASIFFSPLDIALDSWAVGSRPEFGRYYGLMRSGISIGYSIFAFVAGFTIVRYGYRSMFFCAMVIAGIQLIYITVLFVLDKGNGPIIIKKDKDTDDNRGKKRNTLSGVRKILQIKQYRHLVIIGLLIYSASKFSEIYTPYYIADSGGGVTQAAILSCVGGALDVPFYWLSPFLLKKLKLRQIVAVSSAAAFIRTGVLALTHSSQAAIYTSVFASMQYATFYPAMRYYVNKIVPENLAVSAQALITVLAFNFSSIFVSLFGGKLVDLFGINIAFLFVSGMAFVALALLVSGVLLKDEIKASTLEIK
ncbi:MAG: MFS transporter [Bacillota bacterium]|nr:MFS transporter [Bacillota bacterium]